jgi:hypothetical protein
MKAVLSRLYTCLLLFLQLCVRWYNRSSWGRLWSSLKDPFELRYKDLVADIEICSTLVENLANGGARVEIRKIHALSELEQKKLEDIDAKMESLFHAQSTQIAGVNANILNLSARQNTLELQMCQVVQLATASRSIIERIDGDVRCMSQQTYRLEFHQVAQYLMPKVSPEAALLKVNTSGRRNPTLSLPTRDKIKIDKTLRDWASSDRASLLVLRAGHRAQKQATALAAAVVRHLLAKKQSVFWIISPDPRSERMTTIADLFKTIIFQLLQHSGGLFTDYSEQLNLAKVCSPHTEREWVDLICMLFTKIPRPFLVIETHDVHKSYLYDRKWMNRFLELLRTMIDCTTAFGCQLKISVVVYDDTVNVEAGPSKSMDFCVASLKPTTPVPQRLKHLAAQTSLNTRGWKLRKPEQST